jgi:3-oxoadipate enol-lactonase
MPSVRLGELDHHYLDTDPTGERPAVLLLHAFPLAAEMWRPQIDALTAHDYRVLAPDLRGFGDTPASEGPSTMSRLADDILALLAHLGITRTVVVGLSMGGYLAFELVRRAPRIVRALVLADTRAGADDAAGRAGREAFAESALAHGLGWVADAMVPKLLRESPDPALVVRVRELIAAGTPAGVAAAQHGMAQRPDSTATLAAIACPTLVLVGELDRVTPPAEAEKMAAAIAGATFKKFAGAAHLANLEAPGAFDRALLEFLDALPRETGAA